MKEHLTPYLKTQLDERTNSIVVEGSCRLLYQILLIFKDNPDFHLNTGEMYLNFNENDSNIDPMLLSPIM